MEWCSYLIKTMILKSFTLRVVEQEVLNLGHEHVDELEVDDEHQERGSLPKRINRPF